MMMTTRRTFLKQAGIVTAGSWLLPSFIRKKKDIGIQLWTVRDILEKQPAKVLEKIAEIGYKNVEPYGFFKETNFFGNTPKEIRKMLLDNGLKSTSGHYEINSYFHNGDTKDLMACIEAANTLNSEYLTIPSLSHANMHDIERCKKTAEAMNKVAQICKREGLKLAYHNHKSEFQPLGNTYSYEIFLKETDPELVHFELDLYWLTRAHKKPLDFFKQYPHRFPMWHVKDMDKNNKDLNTEIGNGSLDFSSIFAQAKASGMQHFFVEQENNYQPNLLKSIEKSYHYIQRELLRAL